ncbi:MAG: class I SAM-dependent methyltransferase [Acidobacteriota bacterium]
MNHPAVRAAINRRVTGNPQLWPIAWLREVVDRQVPFARVLSIGCGLGAFERTLVELGIASHISGIDASAEMIQRAQESAAESGMAQRISYFASDARDFLGGARDLDAVFFHASLHHFDRLSDLLRLVREALAPRGILYLDEFAGPARNEWTWRHLLRWNAVYWGLPRTVRRTRIVRRPINRVDPTEAIASSGILPAVAEHFRVLIRRDYGGNLLAPIYPSLLRPDQPGGPSAAEFDVAIEALLAREEVLLRRESGFNTVVVAEPRLRADS